MAVLKEGSGRVLGEFWDGFGRILEGFRTDLGWILERFCNDLFWFLDFILEGTSISETFQVEGLTSMIRATRGRSSRPNHMRSHFEGPKVVAPINFRRFAPGVHSVAKQASFNVTFGNDFEIFGSHPNLDAKIDVQAFFFRRHF